MGGGAHARRSDARGRAMRAGRSDACAAEHARGRSDACAGASAWAESARGRSVRGEPARGGTVRARSAARGASAGRSASAVPLPAARLQAPAARPLLAARPLRGSSLFAWSLLLRMACLLAATEVCLVFYRWNLIKVI